MKLLISGILAVAVAVFIFVNPTNAQKAKRGLSDLGHAESISWQNYNQGSGGSDWKHHDLGSNNENSDGEWKNSFESGAGLGNDEKQQQTHQEHGKVKTIIIKKYVHVPVSHPVPVTIEKKIPVPVPVKVPYTVKKPYHVTVPKPYTVTVEKPVPYTVEKKVPYPVKVPVKVPVYHPVKVPVPKPVPYTVHKPVPYEVKVPVVVLKKVPVYVKEHHDKKGENFNGGLESGHGSLSGGW